MKIQAPFGLNLEAILSNLIPSSTKAKKVGVTEEMTLFHFSTKVGQSIGL